ncbi:MAG: TonB-dependent receptor [Gemmatimonadetes bacterium]|nr:TonB-dependent receptor [Gemmatimonadota bacterium]
MVAFFLGNALVAPSVTIAGAASREAAVRAELRDGVRLTVLDGRTGDPLPFANLIRTDPPGGFVAGADGVVRIGRSEPGVWRFRLVHPACGESPLMELTVPADGTLIETLVLAPAPPTGPNRTDLPNRSEPRNQTDLSTPAPRAATMDVIEVRGDAQVAGRRAATGVRTVQAADVRALPNPSDDVFQMVRLLPGVSSDETGAEFHIRGGDTDETLVLVDGLEVRQLFHGRDYGGITSVVPFSVVDGVDVYPGAFPARYGGKLSGVVDLTLREESDDGWHGSFGADIVSTRAFAEHGSDNTSLMVSAREGYLDRVLRKLRDGFDAQSGYRDLFLRAVSGPDDSRQTSLNYLRSEDHIFYDEGIDAHTVNSDYLDHYLWSTTRLAGHRWDARGTVHYVRSDQRRVVAESNQDDQVLDRYGVRLESTVYPGSGHRITVGGQIERETGSFVYRSEEVVAVAEDGTTETLSDVVERGIVRRMETAFFLQDEWKPMRSLSLNLGLRAARDSETDNLRTTPRLSAAVELGAYTVKAGWGRFEQAPVASIDLEEEVQVRSRRRNRAEHSVLGVERNFGLNRVGVDAWYKDFTALDGVVTQATADGVEHYFIREGHSQGLELFLNRTIGASNWWVSYTVGRTEWSGDGVELSRDFDRLHAISLSNTLVLSDVWDLGFSYSYHSGTPYTEQSWSKDDLSRQWIVEEAMPNSSRLPAYQRLDVRLRRQFHFDGWQMAVYAEGLNLTNHENVLWYAWRFANRNGTREPERITRTGLPGLPSLGVEFRF